MKTSTFALSLALAASLSPSAQDTSSLPSFEVASVKESKDPAFSRSGPGRLSEPYITLEQLLTYAHEMAEFQIVGGPDWVKTRRFDVQATAEGALSADRMRLMVRRLLAERFSLVTHVETRDLPRSSKLAVLITSRRPDHRSPGTVRSAVTL